VNKELFIASSKHQHESGNLSAQATTGDPLNNRKIFMAELEKNFMTAKKSPNYL